MRRLHLALVPALAMSCTEVSTRVEPDTLVMPGLPLPSRLPVASITVTPGEAWVEIGKTARLTATLKDSTGAVLDRRIVTWRSDELSIATVDSSGVVTGIGLGSRVLGCICTRVSAVAEGKYADVLVLIGSPPASLEMLQADGQIGPVGGDGVGVESLGNPTISLRFRDASGAPVRGMFPSFDLSGGGAVGQFSRHGSSADGTVHVRWMMGNIPGPNSATARFRQLSSRALHATGVPGQPRTMTRASAEVLTGTPSGTVTAPAVRVADRYGNPIPSHRVVFTVTGGGGSVAGAETVTDANGVATAGTWTLGATPGTNLLRAATNSGTSFVFSVTTTP